MSLMGSNSDEEKDELESELLKEVAQKSKNTEDLESLLQKWDARLPEKMDSFFKSVMEQNLADFKANYRRHTTDVALIVR